MKWQAGVLGMSLLALPVHADDLPDAEMLIFLGEMVDAGGEWLGPDEAETLAALAAGNTDDDVHAQDSSESGADSRPVSGEADEHE